MHAGVRGSDWGKGVVGCCAQYKHAVHSSRGLHTPLLPAAAAANIDHILPPRRPPARLHLLLSWRGPTGDLEREEGEADPAATSSSSDRLSFLSSPASLPADDRWVLSRCGSGAAAASGSNPVRRARALLRSRFAVTLHKRVLTGVGLQVALHYQVPDIHRVQERVNPAGGRQRCRVKGALERGRRRRPPAAWAARRLGPVGPAHCDQTPTGRRWGGRQRRRGPGLGFERAVSASRPPTHLASGAMSRYFMLGLYIW